MCRQPVTTYQCGNHVDDETPISSSHGDNLVPVPVRIVAGDGYRYNSAGLEICQSIGGAQGSEKGHTVMLLPATRHSKEYYTCDILVQPNRDRDLSTSKLHPRAARMAGSPRGTAFTALYGPPRVLNPAGSARTLCRCACLPLVVSAARRPVGPPRRERLWVKKTLAGSPLGMGAKPLRFQEFVMLSPPGIRKLAAQFFVDSH